MTIMLRFDRYAIKITKNIAPWQEWRVDHADPVKVGFARLGNGKLMRPSIFLILASGLFICVVGTSAYLILGACGVRLPFGLDGYSHCPRTSDQAVLMNISALDEERGALVTRISQLEAELGKMQCEARVEEPAPTPAPSGGLDTEAFRNRNLSAMQGCWNLITEFDVEAPRSNKITTFNRWDVCFAEDGTGQETLTATDGTTCEGEVTGSFATNGNFDIDKTGNLSCSNGTIIFRTLASCHVAAGGDAVCDLYQPATGGRESVEMRRGQGSP
ncbi:type IV pilus assembly protein FimV [Pseudooceanicola sp. C21-150M6]|uniref:type IV pilus assembly protein FimV n=1 Tax=Pseudooceanicola sp. C21-150M6 TaxID=3434355 RepID=UPI003D7F6846